MSTIKKNIDIGRLQVIFWVVIFIISFISNLQYDQLFKAFVYAILALLFNASIIYGNAHWLIPAYYRRQRLITYALLALLILLTAVLLRTFAAVCIGNAFSSPPARTSVTTTLLYSAMDAIWIYFFSVIYRLALDYFVLSKKQDEIEAEKAQAELNLLKQQVHPHFLFNTLNNIYYVAHKDSPRAADLIERLSGIIRYFLEESQKARVYLTDEIDLLQSYIELENITMRYEIPVDFKINGNIENITVPPLLLLPMVENIFKHGIDKRSKDNFAEINLNVMNHELLFKTKNRYFQAGIAGGGGKTGLNNLEKRLKLYYGHKYQLSTHEAYDIFMASLQIPVYEN
jgi:sensor histidine kinase YesM